MGKMNIVIPDDLETKFRDTVYRWKGMKKGNISGALEDAITDWIAKQQKMEKKE